uniref:Uncharacterized protein n=1 Tax=Panagrolaimus sp. JU765 TaxID=591449 RepID=A0AC34QT91_9BILA
MKNGFLLLIFIFCLVFHGYSCSESEDHTAIRDYIEQHFPDIGLTNDEIEEVIAIVQKNGLQHMDLSEEELIEYASKFDLDKKTKFVDGIKTIKNQINQIKEVFSRFIDAFTNSGDFHGSNFPTQKIQELIDDFPNDEL